MTPEQRTAINTQNAQLSTGPKTEEGKAKVSQNAVTHGLTTTRLPLQNPEFIKFLQSIQNHFPARSDDHEVLVLELAHLAWKLKQIPSIMYELELNSSLTLAEHFMQDKPTPLTRLWNLELRLLARFNSLHTKLTTLKKQTAANDSSPCHCSVSSGKGSPAPKLQNKPTPSAYSLQPSASILQNKPTPIPQLAKSYAETLEKIQKAIQSVPLTIPNPF